MSLAPPVPRSPIFLVVVLLCFIDPRVRKIRNEAFNCPRIFSSTLCFYYAASSPGSPLLHVLDGQSKLSGSCNSSKVMPRASLVSLGKCDGASWSFSLCLSRLILDFSTFLWNQTSNFFMLLWTLYSDLLHVARDWTVFFSILLRSYINFRHFWRLDINFFP